ncbi:MAG: hypothetical protein FWD80_04530 [Propionibacteriaceae bacterium]|nr:hypothetical protein [Propionibacteriaceae bacterium]
MSSGSVILAQMDRDWHGLCQRSAARAVPWSWIIALPAHAVSPAERGSLQLAHLCELVKLRDDTVTVGLLWLAQGGDLVAGRVVVQAMLPKLWAMARRDRRYDFADYITAAWVRLMTFPVTSRTSSVLVNLSLDCLKWLSRQADRHKLEVPTLSLSQPGDETPVNGRGGDEPPWSSATGSAAATSKYVEEMLALASNTKLLSTTCIAVLRSVYCDGLSSREAAVRHDISYDMVRYYRSSAVRALRAKRGELIEALGPC